MIDRLIQTETIRLKKSKYDCNEDNSMERKKCLYQFISKEIGCRLPWDKTLNELKECKTQLELELFMNVSAKLSSTKFREQTSLRKCYVPNCKRTSWVSDENYNGWRTFHNFTTYIIHLPLDGKVLQRQEVLLADFSTFLSDIGSYLGLFLGASILSVTDVVVSIVKRAYQYFMKLNLEKK